MRMSERTVCDADFPGRYTLDEARFPGGREKTINREDDKDEPTARFR